MENYESLEQYFDKADKNTIRKQIKSPLMGIGILLLGVCFFSINYYLEFDPRGFISPLLVMISFSLTLWGITAIIFRKKKYVSAVNNQKLRKNEVLFDTKEKDKLIKILSTNNYHELETLNGSTHDGLKLTYYTTADESVCYTQVISYISYECVRITEVKKLLNEDAKNLIKSVKQRLS